MALKLFDTAPKKDFLSLYEGKELLYNRVVKYLDFDQSDVSKTIGVPKASVRYDHKIPAIVRERISQWATLLNLVAGYFEGNLTKTVQWFTMPNPLLGDITPRDMIILGRSKKLTKFILNAISENES